MTIQECIKELSLWVDDPNQYAEEYECDLPNPLACKRAEKVLYNLNDFEKQNLVGVYVGTGGSVEVEIHCNYGRSTIICRVDGTAERLDFEPNSKLKRFEVPA